MSGPSLGWLSRLVGATLLLSLLGPTAALGEDRRSDRRRAEWKQVFLGALRDPGTWVPAAGAVVFGTTKLDHEVSDWAVRRTPVFGSVEGASEASDDLLTATRAGYFASAVGSAFRTSGWTEQVRFVGVQVATAEFTDLTVSRLKRTTDRERPNRIDSLSFPSGHASSAFVYANMASANVQSAGFGQTTSRSLGISMQVLAAGTSWGRVESGYHYPSDVLAGAALANFISHVLNDAFLQPRWDTELSVAVGRDGGGLQVGWQF